MASVSGVGVEDIKTEPGDYGAYQDIASHSAWKLVEVQANEAQLKWRTSSFDGAKPQSFGSGTILQVCSDNQADAGAVVKVKKEPEEVWVVAESSENPAACGSKVAEQPRTRVLSRPLKPSQGEGASASTLQHVPENSASRSSKMCSVIKPEMTGSQCSISATIQASGEESLKTEHNVTELSEQGHCLYTAPSPDSLSCVTFPVKSEASPPLYQEEESLGLKITDIRSGEEEVRAVISEQLSPMRSVAEGTSDRKRQESVMFSDSSSGNAKRCKLTSVHGERPAVSEGGPSCPTSGARVVHVNLPSQTTPYVVFLDISPVVLPENVENTKVIRTLSSSLLYPHCACRLSEKEAEEREKGLEHVGILWFMKKRFHTFEKNGNLFTFLMEYHMNNMLPNADLVINFLDKMSASNGSEVRIATLAECDFIKKVHPHWVAIINPSLMVTPYVMHSLYTEVVKEDGRWLMESKSMFYLSHYGHICPWTLLVAPMVDGQVLPNLSDSLHNPRHGSKILHVPRILGGRKQHLAKVAKQDSVPHRMSSSATQALNAVLKKFSLQSLVEPFCQCELTTGDITDVFKPYSSKGACHFQVGRLSFRGSRSLYCWFRPNGIFVSIQELKVLGLLPWKKHLVEDMLTAGQPEVERTHLTDLESDLLQPFASTITGEINTYLISVKYLHLVYRCLSKLDPLWAPFVKARFYIKLREHNCPCENINQGVLLQSSAAENDESSKVTSESLTNTDISASVGHSHVEDCMPHKNSFTFKDYPKACSCVRKVTVFPSFSILACAGTLRTCEMLLVNKQMGQAVLMLGSDCEVVFTFTKKKTLYFSMGELLGKHILHAYPDLQSRPRYGPAFWFCKADDLQMRCLKTRRVNVRARPYGEFLISAELLCHLSSTTEVTSVKDMKQSDILLLEIGHVCAQTGSQAYAVQCRHPQSRSITTAWAQEISDALKKAPAYPVSWPERSVSEVVSTCASTKLAKIDKGKIAKILRRHKVAAVKAEADADWTMTISGGTEMMHSQSEMLASLPENIQAVQENTTATAASDCQIMVHAVKSEFPAQNDGHQSPGKLEIALRSLKEIDQTVLEAMRGKEPLSGYYVTGQQSNATLVNLIEMLDRQERETEEHPLLECSASVSTDDEEIVAASLPMYEGRCASGRRYAEEPGCSITTSVEPVDVSFTLLKSSLGANADSYWILLTGNLSFDHVYLSSIYVNNTLFVNWTEFAWACVNPELIFDLACTLHVFVYRPPPAVRHHMMGRKQYGSMHLFDSVWVSTKSLRAVYYLAVQTQLCHHYPKTFEFLRSHFIDKVPIAKFTDFVLIKKERNTRAAVKTEQEL